MSGDPVAAREMVQRSGQMGVPVIAVDGQTVVGFDQPRLEELLASSTGQSFRLGAAVASATSGGAYVGRVRTGSVADRAGLRTGDIIVSMNGQQVGDSAELEALLPNLASGGVLRVRRGGALLELRVPSP